MLRDLPRVVGATLGVKNKYEEYCTLEIVAVAKWDSKKQRK
jgi:hypothetical protein